MVMADPTKIVGPEMGLRGTCPIIIGLIESGEALFVPDLENNVEESQTSEARANGCLSHFVKLSQ